MGDLLKDIEGLPDGDSEELKLYDTVALVVVGTLCVTLPVSEMLCVPE